MKFWGGVVGGGIMRDIDLVWMVSMGIIIMEKELVGIILRDGLIYFFVLEWCFIWNNRLLFNIL